MNTSPPHADKNPTVSPRSMWPPLLRESTVEVFSTMVGVTVTSQSSAAPVLAQVTGMVGIAGPLCATFSLQCSTRSATMIASQMLGVSVSEARAQKCDAIGEVCIMVAGDFKSRIGLGDMCMLSVPTVLAGNDYQIRCRRQDERLEMLLLYQDEAFRIALDISR